MSTLLSNDLVAGVRRRDRCYGCFRPRAACFCAAIPRIENNTQVLILQHVRERFHPFNTARIVHRALANSELLVDHAEGFAARLHLDDGAALLYPGPEATLISDVPKDHRPKQLVVLDGTWHHAKTFLREVPALRRLPRYRLAPASPSRYRIRREPSAMALSTVEATVAALSELEPETRGLGQLLEAFDAMVERQLAHPKAEYGWRSNDRRTRYCGNLPSALVGDLHNVVVAYGECAALDRGCEHATRTPVYWVAQRLGAGEQFECVIQADAPLEDNFLGHLELTRDHFSQAHTLSDARRLWAAFRRPGDAVVVYNAGTARLLESMCTSSAECLVLKSVDFKRQRRYASLDELVVELKLPIEPAQHPGRAGKRLANAIALVRHFNALARMRPMIDAR